MRVVGGVLVMLATLVLSGCVGSPVHTTFKYHSLQSEIARNNENMLSLNSGMTKQEVQEKMGKPARSEGYGWGSAWFYRTAMTEGIGATGSSFHTSDSGGGGSFFTAGNVYSAIDNDFTPLVFDDTGKLAGWGRNFYVDQAKRYEIKIE